MQTIPSLENRSSFEDRYSLTDVFVDDSVGPGRRRYGLWKTPKITALPELALSQGLYDRYTVTAVDIGRIDLIAWKYYQDVSLWWVIAIVNKIGNPFSDLTIGQVLMIPRKNVVVKAFEEKKTYV